MYYSKNHSLIECGTGKKVFLFLQGQILRRWTSILFRESLTLFIQHNEIWFELFNSQGSLFRLVNTNLTSWLFFQYISTIIFWDRENMGRHIDIQVNKGHHEHEKEAPTGLQQVLFQKIEEEKEPEIELPVEEPSLWVNYR